ncbi:phage/plasmid primase, P4 family [Arthrobacter sp. C152]
MMTTLDAALEFEAAGLSVVPVMTDGTKRPSGQWKEYQTIRASRTKLAEWFGTGNLGVGIITGTISGNIEMAEVEGRGADRLPEIAQLAADSGMGDLWARLCSGWLEQSPSGGWHWFYKIDYPEGYKFPGNTKLAKAANKETLAETRSQGGFVVVAPSAGPVHPTGKGWVRVAGGPATIPTITPDEREAFHSLLATLNEYTPETTQQAFNVTTERDPLEGITPGDDYENKTDWADILTGWTLVYAHGRTRYWRRPGKNLGLSATTGNAEDRDRLYVFTSSTEFEQETPYTKFGAYAVLHHGGDHAAAASALRKAGHGAEPKRPVTELPAAWSQATGTSSAPRQLHSVPPATPATETAGTSALAVVHQLDDHRDADGTLLRSEDGNAAALIDQYGDVLRFNPERGRWLAWDGHRWQWQDKDGGRAREYAKRIGRALPETDTQALNHKRKTLSALGTSNMLAMAQTDPHVRVPIDALDANGWELNTPNGIIDLRTGVLLPPDPTHLHTRMTSCAPDFDADTSMWERFLADTFPGNPELTSYMQRLVGYSSIGHVREHILPFAFGSGGNGKGVFLETVRAVLGDYATAAGNGFLMASSYAQHTQEIARLSGARMVLCSEVNETDRFDEAKVKLLTGGDTLTARFMRQDDFTFTPTHHLWLAGNFRPAVESGGDGFWRRFRSIPFLHTVPPEKRVEDLQGILARDHGPAVLAWIARGAADYAQGGLREPEDVKEATKEYAASVDTVGRFLDEECIIGPDADHMRVKIADLRTAYDKWCGANGEKAVQGRAFPTQLSRHGIKAGRDAPKINGIRYYAGVGLRAVEDSRDDHGGDRGGW